MTPEEARGYLNYLLSLSIRRDQAVGPLASAFIRDNDLDALGLLPDEQLSVYLAAANSFAEPRRFSLKVEFLEKAKALLPRTRLAGSQLAQQLDQEIARTRVDLDRYHAVVRVPRAEDAERELIIFESDVPQYYVDTAQKRAAAYYQHKFRLSPEARRAQNFTGPPQTFEPENEAIHKEFPGACGPFMNARTNAFHVLLPFDLRISRSPNDALESGVRIFYGKEGYSFPLRFEMGRLCSNVDGEVLDIALDDPHLRFVSVSRVKEPEFAFEAPAPQGVPAALGYPLSVLQHVGSLAEVIQVSCNLKVWFDPAKVSILIQGAPDLHEYGFLGASGLMTRSYGLGSTGEYDAAGSQPWQEGLSFNYVNLHLQLREGVESATIPYNTPIFSLYPVLSRQAYTLEDHITVARRQVEGAAARTGAKPPPEGSRAARRRQNR